MTKTIKGLILVALFTIVGCESNDLYSSCTLSATTLSKAEKACATAAQACYVEGFLQCETRVCARYYGDETFCSIACEDDNDCGTEGSCKQFSHYDSKKFCVLSSAIKTSN